MMKDFPFANATSTEKMILTVIILWHLKIGSEMIHRELYRRFSKEEPEHEQGPEPEPEQDPEPESPLPLLSDKDNPLIPKIIEYRGQRFRKYKGLQAAGGGEGGRDKYVLTDENIEENDVLDHLIDHDDIVGINWNPYIFAY